MISDEGILVAPFENQVHSSSIELCPCFKCARVKVTGSYLELIEQVDDVGLGSERDRLAWLEDMPEILQPHDPILGEGVDLPDGDHVAENVAEPLEDIRYGQ